MIPSQCSHDDVYVLAGAHWISLDDMVWGTQVQIGRPSSKVLKTAEIVLFTKLSKPCLSLGVPKCGWIGRSVFYIFKRVCQQKTLKGRRLNIRWNS